VLSLLLKTIFFCGLVTCAILAPNTIFMGQSSLLLVVFLVLIFASALLTALKTIGCMSGEGRYIREINELHSELEQVLATLIGVLVLSGLAIGSLIFLDWSVVSPPPSFDLWAMVVNTSEVLQAVLRGSFAACLSLVLMTVGIVPTTLFDLLMIKQDGAIIEARKKISEKAPSEAEVRAAFPTPDGFGKVVKKDLV